MRIDFLCSTCATPIRTNLPLDGTMVTCSNCSHRHTLHIPDTLYSTGVVARCPACGNDEIYVQKDFNRTLGLFMVSMAIIASIIVVAITHSNIYGFLVLLLGTLLDALLYVLLPNVSICYSCHAQIRGITRPPGDHTFYLGKEEKYRAIHRRSETDHPNN